MKKQILFFFYLLFAHTLAFSQMTQVGAGPWQAYQNAGTPPAGWQTSCTPANWGNPVAGNPVLPAQAICVNNNSYSVPVNGNTNFIWGPAGGNTAFFKHCFTLDDSNGCGDYQLIHNVDDLDSIWVNGVPVDLLNGYACNLHGNIDIGPWLQCGENIIAAQATNTGSGRYFVAELQFFGFSPNPLILTSNIPDCSDPSIQLSSNIQLGTHSWTGPNGYSSIQANPVIQPANNSHEGWYTCTVMLRSCCVQTKSIYVTIPEDCCDETIIVDRENCIEFNFSLSDDTVDKGCMIWKDNGKVVSTGDTYSNTLYSTHTNGTHTICVNYLGTQKNDPDEICCEERCVTVTIPLLTIATTYDTIYTCQDQVWYSPEDCATFDHYVMTDTDPSDGQNYNYNSSTDPTYGGPGCEGWIAHHLIHGDYIIEFYDANGCLQKILQLTLTHAPPVVHYQDYQLCDGECVTFDVNAPDFPCSPNNGILTGYTNIEGVEGDVITICYDTPYRFETTTADGCQCVIEGNINISPPPSQHSIYATWCLGEEELDLSTLFDPCDRIFNQVVFHETWEDLTDYIHGFPPGPIVFLPGPLLSQDNGNIFRCGNILHYRYRSYDEFGCLICEYEITIEGVECFQDGDNPKHRSSQKSSGLSSLKVFPNPSTGQFTVQFSGTINDRDWLKVYDVKGQLLQSHLLQIDQKMDISEYPDGLYFIHYGNDTESKVQEVILQKDKN